MRGYLAHTSETKSIGMTRVFDEDLTAGFGTRAIHAGQRPEPLAGAIMTPVYLTSTYVQDGLGQNKGYEYARGKNPTREAFERNVAALENGRHGFAFSSAAIFRSKVSRVGFLPRAYSYPLFWPRPSWT